MPNQEFFNKITGLAILILMTAGVFLASNSAKGPRQWHYQNDDQYFIDKYRIHSPLIISHPRVQDVNVMVIVGQGLMMTVYHRYKLTALVTCFWVGALSMVGISVSSQIDLPILFRGSHPPRNVIQYSMGSLVWVQKLTWAVLIIVSSMLGKLNSFQILLMTLGIIGCFKLAEPLGFSDGYFQFSSFLFSFYFPTCFSFGVSLFFPQRCLPVKTIKESNPSSQVWHTLGTLLVWCLWPSFNSIVHHPTNLNTRTPQRFFDNLRTASSHMTYLALIGSALSGMSLSLLLSKGKYRVREIMGASLAGAIALGGCSGLIHSYWIALAIGGMAGILSVLSYRVARGFFQMLGLDDFFSVFHFYGVPSFLGCAVMYMPGILNNLYIEESNNPEVIVDYVSPPSPETLKEAMLLIGGIGLGGGVAVSLIIRPFTSSCCYYKTLMKEGNNLVFDDVFHIQGLKIKTKKPKKQTDVITKEVPVEIQAERPTLEPCKEEALCPESLPADICPPVCESPVPPPEHVSHRLDSAFSPQRDRERGKQDPGERAYFEALI